MSDFVTKAVQPDYNIMQCATDSRNNELLLQGNFNGTTFPANPTTGQLCYRTDMNPARLYVFDGKSWQDIVNISLTGQDVKKSAGELDSLHERLNVALNPDGTLRLPAAQNMSEWVVNDSIVATYVSDDSFTVQDDCSKIFTVGRAIRAILQAGEVVAHVSSVGYTDKTKITTVTLDKAVLDNTLQKVQYSIIQHGQYNADNYFEVHHSPTKSFYDDSITDLDKLTTSGAYFCKAGVKHCPNDDDFKNYFFAVNVYASVENSSNLLMTQLTQIAYNGFKMYIRNVPEDWTRIATYKDIATHNTAPDAHNDIRQLITKAVASATPVGTITPFAGKSAPDGYLICDGSSVSRTTYAALFKAIGTTYGSGDGSTTFNLPNLQGRTVIGVSSSYGLSVTGGEEYHTLSYSEMPSHSHSGSTDSSGNHYHFSGCEDLNGGLFGSSYASGSTALMAGYGNAGISHNSMLTSNDGSHSHSVYINSAGSGQSHNNMQPYIALNYIIKY